MLTKGDDYPIHQTAEPVAVAGTDRNFYDRYFFNGYSRDGALFFAAALGVYPHLNLIDAAFAVVRGGEQRSVFASRILNHERLDTHAGPVAVEVVEPLRRLRVTVGANEAGIEAALLCTGRAPPIEEPRFIRRNGSRTLMDVTRLTQNVSWEGSVTIDGVAHDVAGSWGTRDRSWGVRPIGAADAQPVVPAAPPQFYWLWAPLNFDDHLLFFHTNDDAAGEPWNRSAVLVALDGSPPVHLKAVDSRVAWKRGTRHAEAAMLTGQTAAGEVRVELAPHATFFMQGIGYGHPTRGHGSFHGALSVHAERLDLTSVDEATLPLNHIQALVTATLHLPDGGTREGRGVLEQLAVGPHAPSGFTELFDLAR